MEYDKKHVEYFYYVAFNFSNNKHTTQSDYIRTDSIPKITLFVSGGMWI